MAELLQFGDESTCEGAMTKQLQFGDESTADLKLQLIGTDRAEYHRDPLYLHSEVLRTSEFYKTLLSERWTSEKKRPFEINITSHHSGEIYIKCIRLMYHFHAGNPFCFSNVDEALAVLPVASELLFRQCSEECMRYLNAVRWSTKQEVKLRALLLSLEVNPLPDLAARLGMSQSKSDYGGLQMLEQFLQKMLLTISSGSFDHGEYIEEYIVAHFEANASLAETCRSALLKEFSANVESAKVYAPIACSALSWIVNVIERCDGALFELALKMFCKDAEIPKAVHRRIEYEYGNNLAHYNSGHSNGLVALIDRFLGALENGRIITCTSIRVSFLTNWVAIIPKLRDSSDILVKRIIGVAETLPVVDQRSIHNIWKEACKNRWRNDYQRRIFEGWAKKVQDAIKRQNIFFDLAGKIH